MIAQYAPFAVLAVLLVATALELKTGKTPNWLTLIPFAIFIAVAATAPDRTALIWQLLLAVGVFAVGVLLFVFVGFGAGAVKLMSGLALFIPPSKGWAALAIFVAGLFVFEFIIRAIRKQADREASNWAFIAKNGTSTALPLLAVGVVVFFVL